MQKLFESKGESNPFGALSIAINELEARVEALEAKAGIHVAEPAAEQVAEAEAVAEPAAEAEAEPANEEAKPRRRTRKAE